MDFRPLLADMTAPVGRPTRRLPHGDAARAGGPYQGYPVFSAPPPIVPGLWRGTTCAPRRPTTASTRDATGWCAPSTTSTAGIETAGTAPPRRPPAAAGDGRGGVKVGLIGDLRHQRHPAAGRRAVVGAADRHRPDHRRGRKGQACGRRDRDGRAALGPGVHHPPTRPADIVDRITQSPDIDFIYGHHAHVAQPYDKVNGTWVVYGLGNAVAQQETSSRTSTTATPRG